MLRAMQRAALLALAAGASAHATPVAVPPFAAARERTEPRVLSDVRSEPRLLALSDVGNSREGPRIPDVCLGGACAAFAVGALASVLLSRTPSREHARARARARALPPVQARGGLMFRAAAFLVLSTTSSEGTACAPGYFSPLNVSVLRLPYNLSGPLNMSVLHLTYSSNLVHTFSAATGTLYVAHSTTSNTLRAISTHSSLNVTSTRFIPAANNGLQNLCVRPDGGIVAAAFDNAGSTNYVAFSGALSTQVASGLVGAGTVQFACDSTALPLKLYAQRWSGSQPIETHSQNGAATGANAVTGDSWSSSWFIHAPFGRGALFAIRSSATSLYRVNTSSMLVETTYSFPASWASARVVWDARGARLLMGAKNSTCSLLIEFDPLLLSPGSPACVAPANSLVSLVPSIDSSGNLYYVTLAGVIHLYTFALGALRRIQSLNLGFGLSGSGLGGRAPGGVIYMATSATSEALVVVAALNATTAVVARVGLFELAFVRSNISAPCQQCGRGHFCPEDSYVPTPCPFQAPPGGGWGALQAQGPAFLVDTATCRNHCFWNYTSGDGRLSKC